MTAVWGHPCGQAVGPVAAYPEKTKKTCSVPRPIAAVDGGTPDVLCGANRVPDPVCSASQIAHANARVPKT